MISTKELKKQENDSTVPMKSYNSEHKFSQSSCGVCSSCHQMTRIHSMTGSPVFGGSSTGDQGSNLQKHCATNFFQRNMGNNYMQSIVENRQALGLSISRSRVPTIHRKCSCGGSCSGCSDKEEEFKGIQTKLTIGPANDVYEQEADRVAERVMRMSEPSTQPEKHTSTGINVQKLSDYDDGGRLGSNQNIKLNKSGSRPLTPATRKFMEPRFSADFGHVRLHTDQNAHQTASQIQAKAFTYGNDIWFGKGENEGDKSLMAHELTHVIQQGAARVRRTNKQRTVFSVRPDKSLVGQKFIVNEANLRDNLPVANMDGGESVPTIQRYVEECSSWSPVNNDTVRRMISELLSRHNGNVLLAFNESRIERNRDENCCDLNYTAVEHYLHMRDVVGSCIWTYGQAMAIVITVATGRDVIGPFRSIIPRTGNCPVSPASVSVSYWEGQGIRAGSRDAARGCARTEQSPSYMEVIPHGGL